MHSGQRGRTSRTGASFVALASLGAALMAGCGTSSHATTTPSPTLAESATASPSPNESATPTPSATNTATAAVSEGPKSATCVNGWVQPAPGSDFYQQATDALKSSQGGTGYLIKAVSLYFAGPLASGGIGAIYYLDVRDPRLTARVLLVSGAGPSSAAIAKTGSTGWKQGDWYGFKGTGTAAVTPLPGIPNPGKWSGPSYDPVGGAAPLLSSSVAGCLAGS